MGRPRKPWKLPFEEARSRYEGGESAESLAAACGLGTYHPLLRALREAGVAVRQPGGQPGPRRGYQSRSEVRTCKLDGCGKEFTTYPSKRKFYCSPECRYRSPELRPPPRDSKHRLTEVNAAERTAACEFCGPTEIRVRTEYRKYQTLDVTWRCSTAERIRRWATIYGLTPEAVQQMLAEQNWKCGICEGDLHKRFKVDHDHATEAIRGLLCSNCNTGLGLFADDVKRLRGAVRYLERAALAPVGAAGGGLTPGTRKAAPAAPVKGTAGAVVLLAGLTARRAAARARQESGGRAARP